MPTTAKRDTPNFTKVTDKSDLYRLRDTEQRSWAAVAAALGLGSPGAARRLYSALVQPHTDSVLSARIVAKVEPVDLSAATLEQLRKQIAGRTIIVDRKGSTEEILVAKITSLKEGTMTFNDGTKTRSVKAAAILAVK
ncbi:MAG: hypothetical protein ABL886_09920 [Rhodoglobus sp.]